MIFLNIPHICSKIYGKYTKKKARLKNRTFILYQNGCQNPNPKPPIPPPDPYVTVAELLA